VSIAQGIQVTLDPFTWQWLSISFWAFSAALLAFFVMFAYHIIDQWRTPMFSKRETAAHRGKKPALLLVGDEGFADLESGQYTGNEGWSETKERGKPPVNFIGLFPRSSQISDKVEVAPGKDLDATRRLAEYINFLNTRKIFMRGTNNPIWVAVKAKGIIWNIKAIAAIQLTEELQKKWDEEIKALSGKPFPIDVYAIKQMVVGSSYNTSLLKALAKVHELIGFKKKGTNEQISKWVFIAGIAFCGIGMAALIAALLLGG
jgi:hypothetical protein